MSKKKQRKTLFWNFGFGALVLASLSTAAITFSRLPAQGSEGSGSSSSSSSSSSGHADVEVSVSGPTVLQRGGTASFALTIVNKGNVPTGAIEAKFNAGPGLSLVTSTSDPSCTPAKAGYYAIRCVGFSLEPSQSKAVVITVSVCTGSACSLHYSTQFSAFSLVRDPNSENNYRNIELTLYEEASTSSVSSLSSSPRPRTCKDMDDGLVYEIAADVVSFPQDGYIPHLEGHDYCDPASVGQLIEYSCAADRVGILTTPYRCPYGCRNGACLPYGAFSSIASTAAASSVATISQADVSISLVGPDIALPIGSLSSININIHNAGPANSGPIDFTATIPRGTSMTLSESDRKYCQERTDSFHCTLPALASGGVNSISTFLYRMTPDASCTQPMRISMSATGTSVDSNSGNNQASVSLTAQCANLQYGTNGVGHSLLPPPGGGGGGGCTDSDGGEKYDIQGIVASPGSWSRDHCQNIFDANSKLIEYYCSPQGGTISRTVSCPYGCEQGACEPQGGSACVNIREQAACETSERSGRHCRWDARTGLCSPSEVSASSSVSSAAQGYSSTYGRSSPARSAERSSKMPRSSSDSSIEYEDEVRTAEPASRFKDIHPFSLEGQAANELAARNIIGGFPDGEFKGGRPVNRAEAAKFLVLARFKDVEDRTNNGKFWDVLEGEWYEKYVVQAADHDIISGHPDGSFRPADGVNTAEFLKMLSLTFALPTEHHHSYRDVPGDAWYALYAGSAQELNLFPRRAEGVLEPGKFLTREEVAVAIYRVLVSPAPSGDAETTTQKTYRNSKFGISFQHPTLWGSVMDHPFPSGDAAETGLTFSIFQDREQTVGDRSNIDIIFRSFDEGDSRYVRICYEGACESEDLIKQRSEIAADPAFTLRDKPVGMKDFYFAPAATVSRDYTLFLPQRRLRIHAWHTVDDIYETEYKKRRMRGEYPSLSELVQEDLGMEAKDPIRRLIKLYPKETEQLRSFFKDVESMVRSMEVH